MVELYSAAWGVGSNPDPNGFYNKQAQFNYSRWVSAKNDELLARIASAEALDETYRTQAYKEWDENFLEEASIIPTSYRMKLMAVNKRVTSWDERHVSDWDWCDIGLTSDKPAMNTMK